MVNLVIAAVAPRTGSTLLQRICNARKKTLIWGEPERIITDFYNIYHKLRNFSEKYAEQREIYFNNNEDPNNLICCMNPETEYIEKMLIAAVKAGLNFLYSQYSGEHDIIGFKEVLFGEQEIKLIRKCYPECKFLLLVRNPVDIWMSSQGWYEKIKNYVNIWRKNSAFYLEFVKTDQQAYLIRYEDIIQRNEKTLQIISNIARVTREEIEYVLSYKTWSSRENIPQKERAFIKANCSSVMRLLGY